MSEIDRMRRYVSRIRGDYHCIRSCDPGVSTFRPKGSTIGPSMREQPTTAVFGGATRGELEDLVHGVAAGTVAFDTLIDVLLPLIRGTEQLPPDVALQLTTALIGIESRSVKEDQLVALIEGDGRASLALAESGQILAANPAATAKFAVATGDGLEALGITPEEFDRFQARLSRVPGPTLVRVRTVVTGASGRPRRVSTLMSGAYYPWYRAFVLTVVRHEWSRSIDVAFEELYGLSRSELDVLRGLSLGLNSEEIAGLRHRSTGTVRQQVKSILAKLDVPTQLAAATLAAAAATSAGSVGDTLGHGSGTLPSRDREPPLTTATFFRNERRVGFRRFGDSAGSPVLFLHGPSFGAGEYSEDRRLPRRMHLDVHAIERPGYGRSDIAPEGESVLECHQRDIQAFLDRQRLDRVAILAHEVGLIPALDFAVRYPDRVQAILAVSSAPPFVELEHIQAMPEHQGVFVQAARHAPWLAHLLVRLLMVQIRRLGPHEWTDVIFRNLEPDTTVMHRPALMSGIVGTYSFYLNQQGAGFEQDLPMMLTDWGELLSAVRPPLRLIHGTRNPTTPVAHLDVYQELRPDLSFELVEHAGLTLAVSHPTRVYQALARLIHDTP